MGSRWLALVVVAGLIVTIPGCKCGREVTDDPTDTLEKVSEENEEGDPTMLDQMGEDSVQETSKELEELPPEPPEADGDGAGLGK